MANEKRLIDANSLKEKLQKRHDLFVNPWGGFSNLPSQYKARVDEIRNCIAEVVNAPTVDAVPVVHGRWVDRYGGKYFNQVYDCSECKKSALFRNDMDLLGNWKPVQYLSDYCPNCGADMRERSEGE